MTRHTAEKLLRALTEALYKVREAHQIALAECDAADLPGFHESCAEIANEIDHLLIGLINARQSDAGKAAVEAGAE